MKNKKQKLIIAIDMGGRTAKVGIADLEGNVIHRFIVDTKQKDEAIPFYNSEIRKKCAELDIDYESQIKAIGFGCVGPLDPEKGISINAGKIGWYNYPVKKVANAEFNKPIYLINDARSIAVGEWKKGAGRNYHTFLIYSIGTGLGGGIVLNNKIYHGAHNLANEFGHGGWTQSDFRCNCGLPGCIEGLSSANGIEKYFQVFIKENPQSSLAKRQNELQKNIEIKDVADLIKNEDKDATNALSYALKPLCHSISMMIYAFDPQAILIGGGPSELGDPLLKIIKAHLKEILWKDIMDKVDIKLCELRNDAGLIGVVEFTVGKLNNYIS